MFDLHVGGIPLYVVPEVVVIFREYSEVHRLQWVDVGVSPACPRIFLCIRTEVLIPYSTVSGMHSIMVVTWQLHSVHDICSWLRLHTGLMLKFNMSGQCSCWNRCGDDLSLVISSCGLHSDFIISGLLHSSHMI